MGSVMNSVETGAKVKPNSPLVVDFQYHASNKTPLLPLYTNITIKKNQHQIPGGMDEMNFIVKITISFARGSISSKIFQAFIQTEE